MGRSELAVPIISTQLVGDTLIGERESLENLIGATFVFGMRSEAEAARALTLLGLDPDDRRAAPALLELRRRALPVARPPRAVEAIQVELLVPWLPRAFSTHAAPLRTRARRAGRRRPVAAILLATALAWWLAAPPAAEALARERRRPGSDSRPPARPLPERATLTVGRAPRLGGRPHFRRRTSGRGCAARSRPVGEQRVGESPGPVAGGADRPRRAGATAKRPASSRPRRRLTTTGLMSTSIPAFCP